MKERRKGRRSQEEGRGEKGRVERSSYDRVCARSIGEGGAKGTADGATPPILAPEAYIALSAFDMTRTTTTKPRLNYHRNGWIIQEEQSHPPPPGRRNPFSKRRYR